MRVESAHDIVSAIAKLLELAAAGVIAGGMAVAVVVYILAVRRERSWGTPFGRLRTNLGRAILLGLELLVGADIIATVSAPLSYQSLGLLAGVVIIRTFVSFSLETEIEGCWPWQRSASTRENGPAETSSRR